jgi:hypothetical protein
MKNRSELLNLFNNNGVMERDLIMTKWGSFVARRPVNYYVLSYIDLQRPDLISEKALGSNAYWWIIMKWNNIHDIWNDLIEGETLEIPSLQDIYDWIGQF